MLAELGIQASCMVHELRQPLFSIKAIAQMMQMEADNGKKDFHRQLLEQVGNLEELIEYYADMTRLQDQEALYDLNDPVRRAVHIMTMRAQRSGVEIISEFEEGHLLVRGHSRAVHQMAVNLLQNACDAVELVEEQRVAVRTSSTDTRVRLEIEDWGCGVDSSILDSIYEPFVTTKPPGKGTGLGLYITKQLVSEARGRLGCEPVAHGGTKVWIELPRAA